MYEQYLEMLLFTLHQSSNRHTVFLLSGIRLLSCWKCKINIPSNQSSKEYLIEPSYCNNCNVIQELPINTSSYFTVLMKKNDIPTCGFPYKVDISLQPIKKRFYYLQGIYHPDHSENKKISDEASIWLNQAFQTIKLSLPRLYYILDKFYNINSKNDSSDECPMDSSFLSTVMIIHEQLDECISDKNKGKQLHKGI